jgi:precorrin-4/cobalt-precorrin-4 C11-methyltransferase
VSAPPILFLGAGPGHPDLLTVRGARELAQAEVCVYAGSLVHPAMLKLCKPDCELHDSAGMNLEEITGAMQRGWEAGKKVVRLHSGDPSIYGAIGEQTEFLDSQGIPWEVVPGVSSFTASAAVLGRELTLPDLSQTVILTRGEGRTLMPELEKMADLAKHQATLCIFLSVQLIHKICQDLLPAYGPDCPAAVVFRASWEDQKVIRCKLSELEARVKEEKLYKSAMLLVGKVLAGGGAKSRLYDKTFAHMFRKAVKD